MLVSIVIPVYNAERHLRACLESALKQTYDDIELLLIDDGSTDGSAGICDEYFGSDMRVRVEHGPNRGPATARNIGIAKARGEFLFFLDADDRIEKDAIRLLVENQRRSQADLVIADFSVERDGVRELDSRFLFPQDRLLIKSDIISRTLEYLRRPTAYTFLTYVWGKLFRAEIFKERGVLFNPDLRIFEDLELNVRYLRYADSVFYLRKKLYIYSGCPDSGATASGIQRDPLGFILPLQTIREFLGACAVPAPTVDKNIGNAQVHFAIRIMVALFRHGEGFPLWKKLRLISTIVNNRELRKNLAYYSPANGDSRTIPELIRLKLTVPLMAVCLYKARGARQTAAKQAA